MASILKDRDISEMDWPILMKFGMLMHSLDTTGIFGPPMTGTWWSLSLSKISLQSMQKFQKHKSWIFRMLARKRLLAPQKVGFWGIWLPKLAAISTKT